MLASALFGEHNFAPDVCLPVRQDALLGLTRPESIAFRMVLDPRALRARASSRYRLRCGQASLAQLSCLDYTSSTAFRYCRALN